MPSAPSLLDGIFQKAVSNFEATLTDKQRREFQNCTRKHVEDTILGIQSRLALQRKQRDMRKISKFVEGMTQLGKVIEVFVNCDSTVAFVWAPIKFVLLAAGTWVETLDCLLDTYAEIGEFLPGLSQYESFLRSHPAIGIHLQNYYCDVLDFHREALLVFSRPGWKTAFHSSWKTFKTHFGPILTKLKRHRDLLSDEKITTLLTEVNDFRQSFEDKFDDLSRQVLKLHLDNHDEESLRHQEALDRKRQFVVSKLDPPDYAFDLERAFNERGVSTSGDWLRTDPAFCQWTDLTAMDPRALFLNGIPGTGKTILASRVVKHLQQLRESNRRSLVLYFFFKHHHPDKRDFSAMLLSLLSQAIAQDEVLLDLVYQRLIPVNQHKVRSVSVLRELAELALRSQSVCFVVIDGLDECVEPGTRPENAQGELLNWLEALTVASAPYSTVGHHDNQQDERCTRLLISGQRNGFLEERLKGWPSIQIDSSSAHMDDIEAYSEAKTQQIRQRFSIDETIRLDIIRKVNSRALGMFLYAKVVLDNLLHQPTRGHFKRELKAENFPKGMNQAYERVVVHILEGEDEDQNGLAREILGLVICAERPLMWKEIQSRFCIDIQSETADPDLRLLDPCKKYCGSLVEVGRNDGRSSGPDDTVNIVHETARTYLLHTGKFKLTDLHKEMALFCAQYLSSAPFSSEQGRSGIRTHCLTGYYGFLDYAVAHWWKHATCPDLTLDQDIASKMRKLLTSLRRSSGGDSEVVANAITTTWAPTQHLQYDGKDWEAAFPVEERIQPIRNCLESLFNDPSHQDSGTVEEARELYGCVNYKCKKPWCHFFLEGFDIPQARQDHMAQHERPFRCGSDGCYGYQIGFAKESELVKHNNHVHCEFSPTMEFPPAVGNSGIFSASKKGKLDVLQALIGSGIDVNARSPDDSTPLFLAAKSGHYQVCRWLLEQGAEVNARSTRRERTPLQVAMTNNDLDIARLLIGHGADAGPDKVKTNSDNPLNIAVDERNPALVTVILDQLKRDAGFLVHGSVLAGVIQLGHRAMLKAFLQSGCVVVEQIHLAKAIGMRDQEMLEMLVRNERGVHFEEPLIRLAVQVGPANAVELLLSTGQLQITDNRSIMKALMDKKPSIAHVILRYRNLRLIDGQLKECGELARQMGFEEIATTTDHMKGFPQPGDAGYEKQERLWELRKLERSGRFHQLQDYQVQLMLLEIQNKRRKAAAKAEAGPAQAGEEQ
ncbi:hypothetical protein F5144DRAFT_574952 [Chaetomium tenue]|uniref:Uncharacterized protein n=1 Tax=Chaetomium tenue TaxID=1854479 RepID=A0ACB7P9F4_9PEZI|nr:hypothetical protein F5144DRAFT_574952 [Chaetomium globosum]